MKVRLITASLLAAFTTTIAAAQPPPPAQPNGPGNDNKAKKGASISLPFSAPALVNGATSVVTGTFEVNRFENHDGKVWAVGTVIATVPDGNGLRSVITPASLPVDTSASGASAAAANANPQAAVAQAAACGILHLVLGPLDLNVLGLVVHLDQVVLDISAAPGPGNLLGNLLCAIAGLLDGGTPLQQLLTQLTNLLNQLIAAL
jgi:hypothetical protein